MIVFIFQRSGKYRQNVGPIKLFLSRIHKLTNMRLFTGMPVSETFKEASEALSGRNRHAKGIRWIPAGNQHVTTCFIGENETVRLPEIIEKMDLIAKAADPIPLSLERICLWPNRNPYMVWALYQENEAFTKLYRSLEWSLLGQAGSGSVRPHVTLARFKEWSSYRQLELFNPDFPRQLLVDHLVLYESRLSPQGPNYFEITRFRLELTLQHP